MVSCPYALGLPAPKGHTASGGSAPFAMEIKWPKTHPRDNYITMYKPPIEEKLSYSNVLAGGSLPSFNVILNNTNNQ